METDTSPEQPSANPEKPERKRRRPALACEECRRRKVRCDRTQPCANCIRAQRPSECTYQTEHRPLPRRPAPHPPAVAPAPHTGGHSQTHARHPHDRHDSHDHHSHAAPDAAERYRPRSHVDHPFNASGIPVPLATASKTSSSDSAQSPSSHFSGSSTVTLLTERIKELEDQLSQVLSTKKTYPDSSNTHMPPPVTPSKGTLAKTRYFGASHWMPSASLFPFLVDLITKEELQRTTLSNPLKQCKSLARLIKARRSPTFIPVDFGSQLPSKDVCDQLVDMYFRTFETVYRILHVPTFQDEYRRYWESPAAASKMFVIQMQLVLAIGAAFYDDLFSLRHLAIQWVYEAQYWLISPAPSQKSRLTLSGLQTMCLLHLARETSAIAADLVWISSGELVRTAVYMGLHRDPDNLAKMPRLNAELRRRLWVTIVEFALQASIDSGGPAAVSMSDFDTRPPSNFDDEQLTEGDGNEESIPLSSPKPSDCFTQTSVQLAMYRSFPTRVAIAHYLNDFRCKNVYEVTLRLNTELSTACRTLVIMLQSFKPRNEPRKPDRPSDFQVLLTEQSTYRFLIALHQPWQGASKHDPRYLFSRKTSVETAFRLYRGFKPPTTEANRPGGSALPSSLAALNPLMSDSPGSGDPHRLAASTAAADTIGHADFRRLNILGAGPYRSAPYQSLLTLALELFWQLEEERAVEKSSRIEGDQNVMSKPLDPSPAASRPESSAATASVGMGVMRITELIPALEFAVDYTGKRVEAGETNIKGHIFFHTLLAQAEALQEKCNDEEVKERMLKYTYENSEKCYQMLKAVAARTGVIYEDDAGWEGLLPPRGAAGAGSLDVDMAASSTPEKIMAFGGLVDNNFGLPTEAAWDWDSFMNNQGFNFSFNFDGGLVPITPNP